MVPSEAVLNLHQLLKVILQKQITKHLKWLSITAKTLKGFKGNQVLPLAS